MAAESAQQDPPLLARAQDAFAAAIANPKGGRQLAEAVAEDARAAGDAEALAVSLRAAGWAASVLYQHGDARRFVNEAVRVARRANLGDRLTESLVTRSTIHLEEGHVGRARRDLETARGSSSAGSIAEVAFTEGVVEDVAGNFEAAALAYDEALGAVDPGRPDLRTKALINRSLVALKLGQYPLAERHLADARELAASFSPALAAIVTHNQALAAAEASRPVDALRRYDRAERMLRDADLPLTEHFLEKAGAFLALRLLREADAAIGHAIAELRSTPGGSLLLGDALILAARIALQSGEQDKATDAAREAEHLFRRQRRPGWRATAEWIRAQAQVADKGPSARLANRLAGARTTMSRIGDVSGVVGTSLLEGKVLRGIGQRRQALAAFQRAAASAARGPVLLRMQGRLASALEAEMEEDVRRLSRSCRLGLSELEQYRASFASTELRARAAGHGSELARVGLRAAVRSGRPDRVWAWLERTRAVALSRAGSQEPPREIAALLAELRFTSGRLEQLASTAGLQRVRLLRRLARIEGRIRAATWQREASGTKASARRAGNGGGEPQIGVAPSQESLRVLQKALADRAILEYGESDGALVAVAVTRDRRRLLELGSTEEVATTGRRLGLALRTLGSPGSGPGLRTAMASARSTLARLGELLVAPVAPALEKAEEVVVVPPGDLIGIPWGALPQLRDRAVRVAPSATAWWATAGRRPASPRVVAVAGPGLAAAQHEAEQVAALHPRSQVLAPSAASCAAVLGAADGAGVVHMACHGDLRKDSPSFSAFRMADGPLTVHDLGQLARPAHHWILAACDLGNPGMLAGSDLEGVLAALLADGAGAVVAAVVPVPDTETPELMLSLHHRLRAGDSLAEALRFASDAIDGSDPLAFVTGVAFSCFGGG